MIHLSSQEVAFLRNTLESAKAEFEELVHEKEWYSTDVLDLIEASLEILQEK